MPGGTFPNFSVFKEAAAHICLAFYFHPGRENLYLEKNWLRAPFYKSKKCQKQWKHFRKFVWVRVFVTIFCDTRVTATTHFKTLIISLFFPEKQKWETENRIVFNALKLNSDYNFTTGWFQFVSIPHQNKNGIKVQLILIIVVKNSFKLLCAWYRDTA